MQIVFKNGNRKYVQNVLIGTKGNASISTFELIIPYLKLVD